MGHWLMVIRVMPDTGCRMDLGKGLRAESHLGWKTKESELEN